MNPDLEIKKQLRCEKKRSQKNGVLVNSVLTMIRVECHSSERQKLVPYISSIYLFLQFSIDINLYISTDKRIAQTS